MNAKQLKQLAMLVEEQLNAEEQVEYAEAALKIAENALRRIAEVDLPEFLRECGVQEMKLTDGTSVKVKNELYLHISQERRGEAYRWLEGHELGGLIKTEVVVPFARGMIEKAREAVEGLRKRYGADVSLDQTVNAQSLKAALKEVIAAGKIDVPLELFGAQSVDRSIIKCPKKS